MNDLGLRFVAKFVSNKVIITLVGSSNGPFYDFTLKLTLTRVVFSHCNRVNSDSMKMMNKGLVFALLAASPAARYCMAGYPVIQNYRISGKFKCLRVSR